MANQWPNPIYTDGDHTVAVPVGIPVFDARIPAYSTKVVFTQEWQGPADIAAVALGTAHPSSGLTPDYSSYKLMNEGPRRDVGGGQVRWTRTYATTPASYDEYETFAYNVIGYFGSWGGILDPTSGVAPTGRNRQTLPVVSRVAHDFFICDGSTSQTDPIVGGSKTYSAASDIAIIEAQKYRLLVSGTTWWMDIDWLSTNPPFNFSTTPSRATYEGYVRKAKTSGWGSTVISYTWNVVTPPTVTVSDTNGGQLCAEDSRIDRWLGIIWLRRTRFVLAQ